MKIAVPVTNDNQIDGHFGHCESYGVFTISDRLEITEIRSVESPQGCGCKSEIGSVLFNDGVTVLLAGGIGDGAVNKLKNEGIDVIRGCSGDATETVKLFLSGLVEDTGSSCGHHSHHDHGHHSHDHHEHSHHNHEHHDHGHHSHDHHEHSHHNHDHHDHGHHDHGHDHAHNCGCGHGDHHNHDHGHEHAHNCGCN